MNTPRCTQLPKTTLAANAIFKFLAVSGLFSAGYAVAGLASEPLLTRAASVRPNLLFILDDSGSMGGEDAFARHYVLASGTCGTTDLADKATINNQLYYDPAKRYEPHYSNTGAPGTNASTSSFSDFTFYLPTAGQTITNLTTKSSICTASRYDRYEVRSGSFWYGAAGASPVNKGTTNPITTKSAKRTDCAGSTCTLAEEKQNIANWRTYHRTRSQAARAGVGKAFATQPDTFRVGWGTIHASSVAGFSVMKDYGLAKTAFYTWLNALPASGYTPLRQVLDLAGQYYSQSGKNGPWAHSPWKSNSENETSLEHLSCRKSYTILITDGEWNDAAASSTIAGTDQDGRTNTPEIVHNDGVTKYSYRPYWHTPDPRNLGKADKISNTTGFKNNLADVAQYYWARDLRGTGNEPLANDVTPGKPTDRPFWQNMTTYTAGLGVVGSLTDSQYSQARAGTLNWPDPSASTKNKIDDLVHAAHNGGGEYLKVNDADAFATEIGRVVGSIAGEQFSQAGVAASAVTLTAGTKKFVPYYTANLWWGNVKMINLTGTGDESGTAWQVIGTDTLGKPNGTTTIPSHSSRKVYTWSPASGGITFDLTPLTTNSLRASSSAANDTHLLVNTMDQAMIDYIRGKRTDECTVCASPKRVREAVLGDIVNSTPVFIKDNSNPGYENLAVGTPGQSTYDAYKNTSADAKAKRTEGVLFIGANDGMVHGFRETDGQEIFAYVPQSVFGKLHQLASPTYQHQFYVDGPMVESDAYINAPNKSTSGSSTRWANLVLGSTGAGSRSVFALDVTWPTSMSAKSILWEINNKQAGMGDIGNVMSEVQSGITASGDWVAIFGNGPYSTAGQAKLMIVNLSTGALIKSIGTDTSTGNGLGGVRLVRDTAAGSPTRGRIIGAYAGDLLGRVWRFDLSGSSSSAWPANGQQLFRALDSAGNPQPITAMPAVIPRTDKDSGGAVYPGYMVVVGTGKLYDDADQTNTAQQTAYGLWDKVNFGGSGTFSGIASRSDLLAIEVLASSAITSAAGAGTNPDGVTKYYNTSSSTTVDWSIHRGWRLDYVLTTGQRSIFAIEPVGKVVRVDTIAPRTNQYSCSSSASSGFNYLISPLTGLCKTQTTLDTNNDGNIDENDAVNCVYSTEADGEDVVLDIQDNGVSTGYVDVQDSRGHFKARVDDPPCTDPCTCQTPPPASCTATPPSGSTRSWRQLFMR